MEEKENALRDEKRPRSDSWNAAPGNGPRRALGEIATFFALPIKRKCFVCSKYCAPRGEMTPEICGVKYLDGEPHLIAPMSHRGRATEGHLLEDRREIGRVSLYADTPLERDFCRCPAHSSLYLPPIGTKANIASPFTEPSLAEHPPILHFRLQPAFTEYSQYCIDVGSIVSGSDRRTTCMVKNIPNKLSLRHLIAFLSSVQYNAFDFIYLRMDFKSNCNNGYAFINFRSPKYIPLFLEAIKDRRWKSFNSEKRGDLTYARIQGLAMLKNRFKRSDIMHAKKCYWPVLFNEHGEEVSMDFQDK